MIGTPEERRRYKMCLSRIRYADHDSASVAANKARPPGSLRLYSCPICNGFHVILTRQEQERREQKRRLRSEEPPLPQVGKVYRKVLPAKVGTKTQRRAVWKVEPIGDTHFVHWFNPDTNVYKQGTITNWREWVKGACVEQEGADAGEEGQ